MRLKPRPFKASRLRWALLCAALLLLLSPFTQAQKPSWRQATDAELASLLPARAPVEKEHIETELRYPGQIKVTIIRETRIIDYAR